MSILHRYRITMVSTLCLILTILGMNLHTHPGATSPTYAYLLQQKVGMKPIDKKIQVSLNFIKTLDVNDYRTYPLPAEDGDHRYYKALFDAVGAATDVDPLLLAKFAAIESGFQRNAKAENTSATGVFQFIDTTWSEVLARHGDQFSITDTTPSVDPRVNTLMAAMFIKENLTYLKTVIKDREITETDLYIVHFLGRSGAYRFFSAKPTEIAANKTPKAAKQNKDIFYTKRQARTVSQVYAFLDTRLENKVAEFNIN